MAELNQTFEIDYSGITQEATGLQPDDWDPPMHKFFGKKMPNGKMEKEPVYVHQEYPRMMYLLKGEKIIARVIKSDEELNNMLPDGWVKTLAEIGYIGAPSHDEHLALIGSDAAKAEVVQAVAAKRGRPRKVVA